MPGRALIWFRRDLRLGDHPALLAALEHGPTLPVFVLDPAFAAVGGVRRTVLHRTLAALDGELRERWGVPLHIVEGDPVELVPTLAAAADADAVFVTRDYTPYGRRRDAAVGERLAAAGCRLVGQGSPYAVRPGTVRKGDDSAYAVFTPFSKVWRRTGWEAPFDVPGGDGVWLAASDLRRDADLPEAFAAARLVSARGATPPSDPVQADRVHAERVQADRVQDRAAATTDTVVEIPDVGERAAHERLERFIEGDAADGSGRSGLDAYDDLRDRPAVAGTSTLSIDLKWGTIHPRTVLAVVDASGNGPAGHTTFSSELAWRDFYADVLLTQPQTAWRNLNAKMDVMPVDTDAAARARFEAWCHGETGFGIVDAGMRQLAATGWMHNRVRMITASFLVKDLHLPWQWGARWFLDHLVDGDLASNNHGWQWAAGTGTDAAPYFRVFNPTTQAERYDPDGRYVDRWVREPVPPMLDHAAERKEALRRLDVVKAASTG